MAKKKITITIDELTSNVDGVYHKTNKVEINKKRDFGQNTKAIDDLILTRDDENDDSIFHPTVVYVKGTSNVGMIEGTIDLLAKKLIFYFPNLKSKNLQTILKKDKRGYFYATTF